MAYSEIDYTLFQIKALTPYLDDIIYVRGNDKILRERPLTLKMRGFAWYYVYNGNNKSDAYRRAFFSKYNKKLDKLEFDENAKIEHEKKKKYNWSSKVVSISSQIYAKLYIQEAIRRIQEALIRDLKFDLPQSIVEQLHVQATYDPSMFIDVEGRPLIKSLKDIPEKYRCCIEGIETKYYGKNADKKVTSIKLVDRDKARKYLLRMIPEHILSPEKLTLIHKTIDDNNKEIGIDVFKLSDKELIEKYKELEDKKND